MDILYIVVPAYNEAANIRQLINLNKQRMEKDNITAALIRTF